MSALSFVMPGLDPGIHPFAKKMDRRVKPGDDSGAGFRYLPLMTKYPNLRESDFILKDFRFLSGQTLPELRQHFITLGTPTKNAKGEIENAVLLIHNATGTAKTWLEPGLAGELFGAGQPLDAAKYFIVIVSAFLSSSSGRRDRRFF